MSKRAEVHHGIQDSSVKAQSVLPPMLKSSQQEELGLIRGTDHAFAEKRRVNRTDLAYEVQIAFI